MNSVMSGAVTLEATLAISSLVTTDALRRGIVVGKPAAVFARPWWTADSLVSPLGAAMLMFVVVSYVCESRCVYH
jgi:hypothetical protein